MSSEMSYVERFQVRTDSKPNPRPEVMPTTIVSIFEGDQFLGSYEHLFPAYGASTFCPFQHGDRWYALYSADYTTTRMMSLPECQDLGGEEPNPSGFCPVEYYVPRYRVVSWGHPAAGKTYVSYLFDNADRFRPSGYTAETTTYHYGPWQFLGTGFVAGCQWGDDASWKVEMLDLSRIAEGIITRSARFGHFELPRKLSLRDALDFLGWTPDDPILTVIRQEARHLATGMVIDPYDR
jgi:hypothetical protein